MRGRLQGDVQARGTTIVRGRGNQAALRDSLAGLGTRELRRQMDSRQVRP